MKRAVAMFEVFWGTSLMRYN